MRSLWTCVIVKREKVLGLPAFWQRAGEGSKGVVVRSKRKTSRESDMDEAEAGRISDRGLVL